MYFYVFVFFLYHNIWCTKMLYNNICILAFVSYFIYMVKKKKFCFMYSDLRKAKNIFWYFIMASFYIIYMGLRHFCLHTGTRDSWILMHSLWSINQASTRPAVGAWCCQLICTIVGLVEELPFDKHDNWLFPVYQMIRLCA